MPPPGGPEDKTPPTVVTSAPDNGSVFVDLKPSISIAFSERMNRETTAGAVFVSPPVEGEVRIEWKKNELRLDFDEELLIDRTYQVTVGSGATDAHGNRLAQSFTIAFSTGEALDSGSIAGSVRLNFQPIAGASVVAYDLKLADSLNPAERNPLYITQSSSDGTYSLNYIARGDYLVLAYEDRNRNKKWDPPGEGIGLPSQPVMIDVQAESITEVDFDLSARDTVPLRVKDVSVNADHVLKIALSEFALRHSIYSCNIALVASDSGDTIRVDRAFAWQDSSREIVASVDMPSVPLDLRLSMRRLSDIWGNEINTDVDSVFLATTPSPDKKKPSVALASPRPGDIIQAPDAAALFRFDEPVALVSDFSGFQLVDADSTPVQCKSEQPDPFSVRFTPEVGLRHGTLYTGTLLKESVIDRSGNRGPDSACVMEFATLSSDTVGVCSGRFTLNGAQIAQNPRIFTKYLPKGEWQAVEIDAGGRFKFEGLPGQYILSGFLDRDADGFRSPGKLRQLEYSEPFIIMSDTLVVRSRFETENLEINIE
jgi:hypothetical protein